MLSLEQVQQRLEVMNLTKVADITGIKYRLLWKIANNKMLKIPHNEVVILSNYLSGIANAS